MPLLDAIDAIARFESGRQWTIGYSGINLNGFPLTALGFPIWAGVQTKWGITHAAGGLQFEPGTWNRYGEMLQSWNFSQATQKAIGSLCFAHEGFQPWAPYNPKLAAFITANGGPSAFGLIPL